MALYRERRMYFRLMFSVVAVILAAVAQFSGSSSHIELVSQGSWNSVREKYENKVASGEHFIQQMKQHISNKLLAQLLRSSKLQESVAAALASDNEGHNEDVTKKSGAHKDQTNLAMKTHTAHGAAIAGSSNKKASNFPIVYDMFAPSVLPKSPHSAPGKKFVTQSGFWNEVQNYDAETANSAAAGGHSIPRKSKSVSEVTPALVAPVTVIDTSKTKNLKNSTSSLTKERDVSSKLNPTIHHSILEDSHSRQGHDATSSDPTAPFKISHGSLLVTSKPSRFSETESILNELLRASHEYERAHKSAGRNQIHLETTNNKLSKQSLERLQYQDQKILQLQNSTVFCTVKAGRLHCEPKEKPPVEHAARIPSKVLPIMCGLPVLAESYGYDCTGSTHNPNMKQLLGPRVYGLLDRYLKDTVAPIGTAENKSPYSPMQILRGYHEMHRSSEARPAPASEIAKLAYELAKAQERLREIKVERASREKRISHVETTRRKRIVLG